MTSNPLVIFQIANGLQYIHFQHLTNRDIRPDSGLISLSKPVQTKLSLFEFEVTKGYFYSLRRKIVLKWMAPEILENVNIFSRTKSGDLSQELLHGTNHSDTFSVGCVSFYFLTGGSHPFGKFPSQNILKNNPVELNIESKSSFFETT